MDVIREKLWKYLKVVTDWFFENHRSLNLTKFHYRCLSIRKGNDTFNFENISSINSKEEKILGLTIDNKLSLDNYVKKICKKVKRLVLYQEYQII